jgi:Ca2+-binding EF-hand superfamily protein
MTDLDDVKAVNIEASELTELRQSFEVSDSDGDGWINNKEFASLLQSLDQELSEDECLLAFELTDADGDGLISFEEFMGWWTE